MADGRLHWIQKLMIIGCGVGALANGVMYFFGPHSRLSLVMAGICIIGTAVIGVGPRIPPRRS